MNISKHNIIIFLGTSFNCSQETLALDRAVYSQEEFVLVMIRVDA